MFFILISGGAEIQGVGLEGDQLHDNSETAMANDENAYENASEYASSSDGTFEDDVDEGSQTQSAPGDGGRRTGRWYRDHQSEPLFKSGQHEACRVTVSKMASLLLGFKMEHNVPKVLMDKLARMLHEVVLPSGNLMPPSLHLLQHSVW
jgi:hypothetical protein